MTHPIEDYALIGDCQAAALVGREGSIDWLCLPHFDSAPCFAALLGSEENGRWLIRPSADVRKVHRRYREETLVLETEYDVDGGTVRVIDFMPPRTEGADVVRIVEGVRGVVPMQMSLLIRFDYGSIVPWVRTVNGVFTATGGPERIRLRTPVALRGEGYRTVAEFTVHEGQRIPFDLTWGHSYGEDPPLIDPAKALERTTEWWREWAGHCTYIGGWKDAVLRSLIVLKALTFAPTGGLVAAPTTSLPERLGGVRNWDYRYCWLRDATFTLYALLLSGYREEAKVWREWLLRAVAGKPSELQILYGLRGERRILESEIPWLQGYGGSRPVRVGNAAHHQLQIDVYGEVVDTMHHCWREGIGPGEDGRRLVEALLGHLESIWDEPDEGIWEVRGPKRHFTHSKIMAWVAFDRAVKGARRYGLRGPFDRWDALQNHIRDEVCRKGYNAGRGAFVQSYGSTELDASLLMIPLVGFLPATDPRVRSTVEAIGRELSHDGFIRRYDPSPEVDGLPPGEGAFLLCTFWYADVLALLGREEEARQVFERVLEIRNDVGLLSESYDVDRRRLVGNFPQAFSHVGLVNTARNLSRHGGPSEDRPQT